MRIVVDTQLWLRGTRNSNSLAHKVIYKPPIAITFIYSTETLAEIDDIFSRAKVRVKFPLLTDEITQLIGTP